MSDPNRGTPVFVFVFLLHFRQIFTHRKYQGTHGTAQPGEYIKVSRRPATVAGETLPLVTTGFEWQTIELHTSILVLAFMSV